MNFISPEEEAQLIAEGEKPYRIAGETEFSEVALTGIPTGIFHRCYGHISGGTFRFYALSDRTMTPTELDAWPMRKSNGSVMGITYGEWKKEQEHGIANK